MQGTWSYEGKTIRVVGHTGGTGQNLGNGTARLSQPFVLHIHEARTDQRILIGSCTGEAKTGAVVAIDAMCSYYTNDFQDTGITAPISFRLVDERLVHYPVYTAYETALGGPACSGGMPCPAPVDGIYF